MAASVIPYAIQTLPYRYRMLCCDSGLMISPDRTAYFINYNIPRSLWAPSFRWWPFQRAFGPSDLLDFVLCPLCDRRSFLQRLDSSQSSMSVSSHWRRKRIEEEKQELMRIPHPATRIFSNEQSSVRWIDTFRKYSLTICKKFCTVDFEI